MNTSNLTEYQEKRIKKMLSTNNSNYYAVKYFGEKKIHCKHSTLLSNIVQCGQDSADFGIELIIRCGNYETN